MPEKRLSMLSLWWSLSHGSNRFYVSSYSPSLSSPLTLAASSLPLSFSSFSFSLSFSFFFPSFFFFYNNSFSLLIIFSFFAQYRCPFFSYCQCSFIPEWRIRKDEWLLGNGLDSFHLFFSLFIRGLVFMPNDKNWKRFSKTLNLFSPKGKPSLKIEFHVVHVMKTWMDIYIF